MDGLCHDFAFFEESAERVQAAVELIDGDPPHEGLPISDATVYTPRNVVYRDGSRRFIDYHGRAMGVLDESSASFKIYSRDMNLLYEAAYLYLLSTIGGALDTRGIHRIHALGVVIEGRAVLTLLPMGGGKSTLGLHLLKIPEVQILSDDSPYIDRKGRALAYPLRLGLLPGSEQAIPPEHRRVLQRMEFGPKHLVNYSYFKDRVCAAADPGIVFIGSRRLSKECHIEEVGKITGARACIANGVIGVGLFQGLEFILQSSAWELVKWAGVGASRFRNCVNLVRRSRVCRVHLGSDPELNARTVFEYARTLPRPAPEG